MGSGHLTVEAQPESKHSNALTTNGNKLGKWKQGTLAGLTIGAEIELVLGGNATPFSLVTSYRSLFVQFSCIA
ncbi:MAG: hypothetical protein Aurels2KO_02080 [Aureliella sp.]